MTLDEMPDNDLDFVIVGMGLMWRWALSLFERKDAALRKIVIPPGPEWTYEVTTTSTAREVQQIGRAIRDQDPEEDAATRLARMDADAAWLIQHFEKDRKSRGRIHESYNAFKYMLVKPKEKPMTRSEQESQPGDGSRWDDIVGGLDRASVQKANMLSAMQKAAKDMGIDLDERDGGYWLHGRSYLDVDFQSLDLQNVRDIMFKFYDAAVEEGYNGERPQI